MINLTINGVKPAWLMTLQEYKEKVVPVFKSYNKFLKPYLDDSESKYFEKNYGAIGLTYDESSDFIKKYSFNGIPPKVPSKIKNERDYYNSLIFSFFPKSIEESDKIFFNIDKFDKSLSLDNKVVIKKAIDSGLYYDLIVSGKVSLNEIKSLISSFGYKIPKSIEKAENDFNLDLKGLNSKINEFKVNVFNELFPHMSFIDEYFGEFKSLISELKDRYNPENHDSLFSYMMFGYETFFSSVLGEELVIDYTKKHDTIKGIGKKTQKVLMFMRLLDNKKNPILKLSSNYPKPNLWISPDYVQLIDNLAYAMKEDYANNFSSKILRYTSQVSGENIPDLKSINALYIRMDKSEGDVFLQNSNGFEYSLKFQIIGAGGYDVQQFHFRYLAHPYYDGKKRSFEQMRQFYKDFIPEKKSTKMIESNSNDVKIDESLSKLINSLLPNSINEQEYSFLLRLISDYFEGVRYSNRTIVEKIGAEMGVMDLKKIKELTELSIVVIARKIARDESLDGYKDRFDELVNLYQTQVNISLRTAESVMLQQYSTPITIGFLAGMFCGIDNPDGSYFEPSAGNGALTILGNPSNFTVNEVDDNRYANLQLQGFKNISDKDASKPFTDFKHKFDAVLTNPPFGGIENKLQIDKYEIKGLETIMSIHALDCMKDKGRCAIIIGGHTEFDKDGLIQAGKNRTYFLYLFKHYNVIDVININGAKLYSRQGTSFNTRLILIDGRKDEPSGFPFKKNDDLNPNETMSQKPVSDFNTLYERVEKAVSLTNVKEPHSDSNSDTFEEKKEMESKSKNKDSGLVIGFANQYYTLWNYWTEKNYVQDSLGNSYVSAVYHKYSYIKNISKELGNVKEAYPDLNIIDDLRGKQRYYERVESVDLPNDIFWNGKYTGVKVDDILVSDFKYCLWYVENGLEKTREYIKSNPIYIDYIKKEEEKINNIFSKSHQFKEGEEVELTFNSNGYNPFWSNNGEIEYHVSFGEDAEKYGYDSCFANASIYDEDDNEVIVKVVFNGMKKVSGMYPYIMPCINGVCQKTKNKTIKVKVKNPEYYKPRMEYGKVVKFISIY